MAIGSHSGIRKATVRCTCRDRWDPPLSLVNTGPRTGGWAPGATSSALFTTGTESKLGLRRVTLLIILVVGCSAGSNSVSFPDIDEWDPHGLLLAASPHRRLIADLFPSCCE